MLVVVASRFDDEAAELVRQWGSDVATLLTPLDLSKPAWRYYSHNPCANVAVVSGQIICVRQIRGVVTLMPTVLDVELDHITAEDRPYVAAEMHAFLFAWLSGLECSVLNRPSQGALWGPQWSRQRWMWAAHEARMAVWSERMESDRLTTTCLVGDQLFGSDDPSIVSGVRRLATKTGLRALTVTVCEDRFVHASPRPALAVGGVAQALRQRLETGEP